jgi:hypothetical protein
MAREAKRRRLILAVVRVAQVMVVLDATVVKSRCRQLSGRCISQTTTAAGAPTQATDANVPPRGACGGPTRRRLGDAPLIPPKHACGER